MTLFEVGVIIAVVMILAVMLLHTLLPKKIRSYNYCVSNLKQVSLAYRVWHFRWRPFGNIGFADGSVQQLSSSGLRDAFQQTGLATNRQAIP